MAGVGKATGWLVAVYGALAFTAAGYALYMGNVVRVNSEFSGLPLMALALPWSALLHGRHPQLVQSSFNNSVLVMLAYVAINGVLLLAAGRLFGRLPRTGSGVGN